MAEESTTDPSILRPAIQIGVRGINQIIKVYQTGTEEMRKLLGQECDIIFECKVCRSLFRGLPNLIAHKRVYCMKEYVEQRKDFPSFYSSDFVTVIPEAAQATSVSELNRLLTQPKDSGESAQSEVLRMNLMSQLSPRPPFIASDTAIVEPKMPEESADGNDVEFEEVDVTKSPLKCSICRKSFAAMKYLIAHTKNHHARNETLFKCSCCPSLFTHIKSVRRHLARRHGKSSEEISRLVKLCKQAAVRVADAANAIEPTTSLAEAADPNPMMQMPVSTPAAPVTSAITVPAERQETAVESMMGSFGDAPINLMESDDEGCTERLTCPDCGKSFIKQSILDRHMKVCAEYAKIAVTFDMSLNKGMQLLASQGVSGFQEKSGEDGIPSKQRPRKGMPVRVDAKDIESDMESDAMSIASESSKLSDGMPKLVPISPLKPRPVDTSPQPCRPIKISSDKDDAKQAKIKNIETVLQFLKNPSKRSIGKFVEATEIKLKVEPENKVEKETENESEVPPSLERVDIGRPAYKTFPPTIMITRHKASLSENEKNGGKVEDKPFRQSPMAKKCCCDDHESHRSNSKAAAPTCRQTHNASPKTAATATSVTEKPVGSSQLRLTRKASKDGNPPEPEKGEEGAAERSVKRKRHPISDLADMNANEAKRRDMSQDSDCSVASEAGNRRNQKYSSISMTRARRPTAESDGRESPTVLDEMDTAATSIRKSIRVVSKTVKKEEEPEEDTDDVEEGMFQHILDHTSSDARGTQPQMPSNISQYISYSEKLCKMCNKKFVSISSLITHASKVHMKMRRYRCGLCSLEGLYFSDISRHIARTHRKEFRENRRSSWVATCVTQISPTEDTEPSSCKQAA